MSIFSSVKNLRYKKNAFNLSHDNMFTCDIGQVVPVFVHNDLLPNSDLRVSTSQLSRFQALLAPLQHKMDAFIHFWKIPYRLLDKNFPDFIAGKMMRDQEVYNPAFITYQRLFFELENICLLFQGSDYDAFPDSGLSPTNLAFSFFRSGTLLDMLGYPVNDRINSDIQNLTDRLTIRPIQAYAWLNAERYTNENFVPSVPIPTSPDFTTVPLYDFVHEELLETATGDQSRNVALYLYFLHYQYGNAFFNHAYSKDYFTSSLPMVQIGDPVTISLTGNTTGEATLKNGIGIHLNNSSNSDPELGNLNLLDSKYIMTVPSGHIVVTENNSLITVPSDNGQTEIFKDYDGNLLAPGSIVVQVKKGDDSVYYQPVPTGVTNYNEIQFVQDGRVINNPFNVSVNLDDLNVISINELRVANALQSLKEAMARFGTRFNEWLKGFWDQDSSDRTLQLPEFLGGGRVPITISDIEQTSATDNSSIEGAGTPLGTLAGKARAVAGGFAGFKTHIEEPSLVIGLFFIKPKSVYGNQGLNRHLTKLDDMFDFFNPKTEHLGEQAVKQSELFYSLSQTFDPESGERLPNTITTFGYQSRYAEYKFWGNEVHGQFMNYLSFWHLGRIFSEPPVLGNDFIYIDPKEQKRPFAVQQVDGADISNVMTWLHFEVHYLAKMSHFGTPMLLN